MTKTIAAALLSATFLLGGASVAAAQESAAPPPARCEKLEALRTRIAADAETPGSVAWLRARADRAEAEGHDRVADALRRRADRRERRIEVIDRRLEHCTGG